MLSQKPTLKIKAVTNEPKLSPNFLHFAFCLLPFNFIICFLLILSFSFTCRAQEENENSLTEILTDECGAQPDSLDDYYMPSEFANVEVAEVTSGNTIVVILANKSRKQVRLAGIAVSDIKTNEGKAAQQFLSSLISGKKVFVLQYEKTNADNMEGVVTLAGSYTDINLSMLKSKTARYIESKFLSDYDNCAYKQITANQQKK